MGGAGDSGSRGRRRVDAGAKQAFLAALRDGAHREEAATRAGFSSQSFYYARRRDEVFRLAWIWALELSAADRRAAAAASTLLDAARRGEIEIAPNNRRALQLRRVRHLRFTDARKKTFLDHFAGTADVFAAAEAAGVHVSTVYKHRRTDAAFADRWDEALRQSYALLEAEAVRQRLAAQDRLRESPQPTGETAQEFERVLKLLARFERRDGRIGTREARPGRQRRMDFDEAIALLDRKLRALGARHGLAPAPAPAAEGAAEGESGR